MKRLMKTTMTTKHLFTALSFFNIHSRITFQQHGTIFSLTADIHCFDPVFSYVFFFSFEIPLSLHIFQKKKYLVSRRLTQTHQQPAL
mmetsp:Transcript_32889/g.38177  ORF Transcript_32889/g.38177 Transcript_32889/m.38177 type:complete len:87 (+) Transcript_32889:390-650(+)